GGQSRHALDHPRRLGQPIQIVAYPVERAGDVEVIDADQLAAAAVEEDELAERAQLEGAAEPRAHAPGGLRHAADLAEIARIEGDETIALTQRSEEHTSELQSPDHLVCRLLLEKKKAYIRSYPCRACDVIKRQAHRRAPRA